jgi:dihydropteroate synthase
MTERDAWFFPHAKPLVKKQKTLVMGIVNMTPDSFSGRNAARTPKDAVALATEMLANGADMIDIGAESSRPGAGVLTAEEERFRIGDAVARLRDSTDAPISVDTYHAETAAEVLRQGADIINDITALRGNWAPMDRASSEMAKLVAEHNAHVVLMHMPAAPAAMQRDIEYGDVVAEVREFLRDQAEFAQRSGINADNIWLDPGFGFGKDFRHNRELLLHLGVIADLGYPVLAGLSRKRMIYDVLQLPPEDRLEGSLALAVIASLSGADILRVHDVLPTARALAMADAVSSEE